ncbi:hypothetical protein AB4Y86_04610, partial [Arthrobacter sp. 2YAF22_2]
NTATSTAVVAITANATCAVPRLDATSGGSATAGAILGLAVPGVEVEDIATTAKTMPDFPQLWAAMLGQGTTAQKDAAVGPQH